MLALVDDSVEIFNKAGPPMRSPEKNTVRKTPEKHSDRKRSMEDSTHCWLHTESVRISRNPDWPSCEWQFGVAQVTNVYESK